MIDALSHPLRILAGALIIVMMASANSLSKETTEQALLEAYVTAAINITQFMAARRRIVEQADSEEQAAAFNAYVAHRVVAMIEDLPNITFAEYQDISEALKSDLTLKQQLTRIAARPYGS